jgi:two-component system, LytTR family, response regulator
MQNHKRGRLPFRISTTNCDVWLHAHEIIRLEAELKLTKIYTTHHSEPIIAKHGLRHLEKIFTTEPHLFRCHRSHIINMEYIRSSSNETRTITTPVGDVPLARNKTRYFREKFCKNNDC